MAAGDVRHFSGSRTLTQGAVAISDATVLNLAGTANLIIKVSSGTLRIGQTGVVSATSGFIATPGGNQGTEVVPLIFTGVVVANMAVIAISDQTPCAFEIIANYTA